MDFFWRSDAYTDDVRVMLKLMERCVKSGQFAEVAADRCGRCFGELTGLGDEAATLTQLFHDLAGIVLNRG